LKVRLLMIIVLFLALTLGPIALLAYPSQSHLYASPASSGLASLTTQTLDVTYSVFLSSKTGLLEGITHGEKLNITATLPVNPNSTSRTVSVIFIGSGAVPFGTNGVSWTQGSPSKLPTFEPAASVGPFELITFILPDSAGTFTMGATGSLSEYSALGQSGAEIPLQYVRTNFGMLPTSYELIIRVPPGLRVLTVYSYTKGLSFVGKVDYETYSLGGVQYLSSNYFSVLHGAVFANVVTLLYAGQDVFLYVAEAVALLVVVLLTPFWIRYLGRANPFLSRLLARVQAITPKQLFTIFVLGCLFIVSFSFVVGPNPNGRVYVMGASALASQVGRDIKANTTFVPIYESQVEQNSATVSTLGGFVAIVLVNPTLGNPSWSLIPYATSDTTITLAGPTHVIVLAGDKDFNAVADQLFPNVKLVNQTSDVIATLNSIAPRQNPLGLNISSRLFTYSEVFIALMSFLLAFLAMAFLAAKVAEVGLAGGWVGVAEAMAYAFFAFVFLQMAYIVSSVFLAVPLGLHSGNPQITAAGTLGLAGGGSRPRELAGIAGFVFGALTRTRFGVKINKAAIILTLGLVVLLILDPLTNGVIFHELILALSAGASQGQAAQSINFIGGLLFNIGDAFASLASQWYFIQRGLILYFAGAVAFVLVPKLQRTTATFLLLFSALLAGDGIVRVADMIPLKTMASAIPGFMAGLLVIAVFMSVSSFEKLIRGLFKRA
jgi:hypothetical protein